MTFKIKPSPKTLCAHCVFCHVVKAQSSTDEDDQSYICMKLRTPMAHIKECNQYVNIIKAGIPMSMAAQAWLIDPSKLTLKHVGFRPPNVPIQPEHPSVDAIGEPEEVLVDPDEQDDDDDGA